jgi:ATP-dependent DNA helicase RecQ
MREQGLLKILKETFGYSSFRLEQARVIDSVLDGHDTLALMPTGGGKSLCYQVPALYSSGVTLVVSPLISLMQDQVMNLRESGVEAVFLNSSQSLQESRLARQKLLRGEVKIAYVSPEGILGAGLLEFFSQVPVSLVAIDEAHCVSQWGHEFRKDYTRLGELKEVFPNVPFIALTATADARTRADICEQLKLNQPRIFVCSFDRPNIKYMIQDRADEMKQLERFIRDHHPNDTGIVYCLSRDKVERVASALSQLGYPAVPYHAGLPAEVRARNQQRFNAEERIIVVATIAFGMGIDRPDVRFVAHLDLPKSLESYYQETGRAGRDGKASSAWMIYGLQDVVKLSQMLETTEADETYKKLARHKLDCMLALCETANCRRQYVLGYFGEESSVACGNCDTCLEPPVRWDATVDAQKVMSAIYRTGQTYGAAHVIDVLRGSKSARVLEKKHDQLTVFGLGKDKTKEHWNTILRQLLNLNFVAIKSWEYRSLCLTSKALSILTGGDKLELRKQELTPAKKGKRETQISDEPELFAVLKALRNKLARERGVPTYIIFNDRSLHDMCNLRPRTPEEFLLVHGVGQSKLENYGQPFLAVINQH